MTPGGILLTSAAPTYERYHRTGFLSGAVCIRETTSRSPTQAEEFGWEPFSIHEPPIFIVHLATWEVRKVVAPEHRCIQHFFEKTEKLDNHEKIQILYLSSIKPYSIECLLVLMQPVYQ